jgi:uncharacterized protein YndB with AHSA1/START domain
MTETPMAHVVEPGVIRFERRLHAPAARVWEALTSPAVLERWMAKTEADVRSGGSLTFDFGTEQVLSRITRLEPGSMLEYTWGDPGQGQAGESLVRFELSEDGEDTLLVLTLLRLERRDGPAFGAAWHAHLDQLEAALEEREVAWAERWSALRPRYAELLA